MEDDKLGEFFRNRINGPADEDEWANPSPNTDQQILRNLSNHRYQKPANNKSYWSKILIGSGIIVITAMTISIFQLNNQIQETKKQLETSIASHLKTIELKNNQIKKSEQTITNQKNEIISLTATTEKSNKESRQLILDSNKQQQKVTKLIELNKELTSSNAAIQSQIYQKFIAENKSKDQLS